MDIDTRLVRKLTSTVLLSHLDGVINKLYKAKAENAPNWRLDEVMNEYRIIFNEVWRRFNNK